MYECIVHGKIKRDVQQNVSLEWCQMQQHLAYEVFLNPTWCSLHI